VGLPEKSDRGVGCLRGGEQGPSVGLQERFLIRGRDVTMVEGGGWRAEVGMGKRSGGPDDGWTRIWAWWNRASEQWRRYLELGTPGSREKGVWLIAH
jgi:hypothetical protein